MLFTEPEVILFLAELAKSTAESIAKTLVLLSAKGSAEDMYICRQICIADDDFQVFQVRKDKGKNVK